MSMILRQFVKKLMTYLRESLRHYDPTNEQPSVAIS